MKPLIKKILRYGILLATLTNANPSYSDGFGWYAYAVSPQFYSNTINGGFQDLNELHQHMEQIIEIDKADDNFPYTQSKVSLALENIVQNGIDIELNGNENHNL